MIGNKQQMWKAVQNFKNRKAFEEKQNHFIVQKLISIRISFYFWNLEFLSFFFVHYDEIVTVTMMLIK